MPEAQPLTLSTPIPALAGIERLPEGGRERDGLIGLDRNERLSALPDAILDELRAAIDSRLLTEYPSTDALYDDLAAHLGMPRRSLLLTPGSDGAVRALHHAYVRPGDRTVMLTPSYAMYPIYTRMFGGQPDEVAFADDLSLDTDDLLARIRPGVRAVLIANPNQPTGTMLGEDVLEAIVKRAADAGALAVIDEAYFPFSATSVLPWTEGFRNLVVLRTFSKAWGLAGLRAGAVIADPEVTSTLFKVRSAYDLNAAAVLFLRTFLAHPEIAADYVAEVDAGRATLRGRLAALGLTPLGGHTNFQVFRVDERVEPAALIDAIRARGFLLRGPFGAPCLAGCVRATLGPPELMHRFGDALEDALR